MLRRHFEHSGRIERQALFWIILALVPATLIHIEIIPFWLVGFAVLVVMFRLAVYKGWLNPLSGWIKAVLMLFTTALFVSTSQVQFNVENAVGFFVLAYSLKLIELNSRRDGYIFSFMTLFLLALSLLFSQSLFRSMYVFVFLGLGLLAMMSLNAPLKLSSLGASVGRVYGLMFAAIPILILLYIVFPRFGPLWSMPLKSNTAFTGLDDDVSPGDVASLAQSGERAFRAAFTGQRPASRELYWRGLILDQYEAGRWSRSFVQANNDKRVAGKPTGGREADYDYEILLDPHNREWGFVLEGAEVVAGEPFTTVDQLARFSKDVKSATWYRVRNVSKAFEPPGSWEIKRLGRVPQNENPQTLEWANQLKAAHPDPRDQINRVLEHLNQSQYFYTLNPPLLPAQNRADAFLFGTKRGFCEHYASSVGFLFRAMGIPTRMVTGYQGGEWNDQGGFLVVHQYDAHAWLEVWLEGEGWVRVDPTAAVAPSRVEAGIREAVAAEGSFLQNSPLALAKYSHITLIGWIRGQAEYINYEWLSMVVNYDQEAQRSLLGGILGKGDIHNIALVMAVVAALVFAFLGFITLWPEWRKRQRDPVRHLYRKFVGKVAVKDSSIHLGMTPRQILRKLSRSRPAVHKEVEVIVRGFELFLYGDHLPGKEKKEHLRRLKVRIGRLSASSFR